MHMLYPLSYKRFLVKKVTNCKSIISLENLIEEVYFREFYIRTHTLNVQAIIKYKLQST